MFIYTVKKGDTIMRIAREYNASPTRLLEINNLSENDRLPVGAALVIPTETGAHIVRRGDSLYSIAMHHGTTVDELLKLNPTIKPPYTIYPGQYIVIPGDAKLGSIDVNGYCYPSISDETLNKTLPYLTYLSVFSYNIRPDGSFTEIANDDRIIAAARAQNVAPLMVITNLNSDDSFDSQLALRFLRNDVAQQKFIDTIPAYLKRKGYMGVNLDFEYVYDQNKDDYSLFMKNLGERLSAEGLLLTTALAPKTSDNQQGILYEGHDYRALGQVCDWIMLMTYDWGYVAGPPMAVSPYNEVDRVLRYAVKVIPPEKLLLGMPNYAYDWTLPYQPGTRAKYYNLNAVLKLAADTGAEIEFNDSAKAPFFTYRDASGKEHIVWFDDARSYRERMRLVNEYGLGGIGFWTINTFFAPGWYVLSSLYDINKVL